jgi:Protein of unknown function (DUF3102)
MYLTEIEQSLAKLAEEINQEHQAFRGAFKATFRSALRAGDLLNEAKAQAGHGDWTGWVEENCEFSMRTAQVYMRLANNREAVEKNLKSAEPAHLSIEDVLRELSSPKEYTVTIETTQEPAEEVEHRIPISLTEGVEGTKVAADAWKTSIPVTGAEEEPALSAEEEAIRERFQSGGGASVLIDMGTHKNLMEWAKRRGVFAKIDRSTD